MWVLLSMVQRGPAWADLSTIERSGEQLAARLRHFKIEPVNAEDLPPDGSSSWSLLQKEIKSCEIFILISGQNYGWIPSTGAGVHIGGAYVSPFLSDIEAFLLRQYSLTGVRADADSL